MMLCRGQQGTSAGEETGDGGGGGSDERGLGDGPARGKWGGAKGGERGKKARGKKAEEGGAALEGRSREGWERVGGGRTGSDLQWGRINLRSVKNALGQWGVDTETLIRGAVIDSVNNAHLGFTYLLLPHTLP